MLEEYSVMVPQEQTQQVLKKKTKISIGIPKEKDPHENRVGLSPEAVSILSRNDFEIIIEKNAGLKANFTDADYVLANGKITNQIQEVFSCDIIVKINPLNPAELEIIKNNATLFSAVNPMHQQKSYFETLIEKRITHLGFEFFEDKVGDFPIIRAMSEIAGSAALLIASEYLSSVNAGKGIILGGITGVPPTNVVILGAGTVAEYAARSAMGLGASIKIFDNQIHRLKRIQQILGSKVYTSTLNDNDLNKALSDADVVIGALRSDNFIEYFKVSEDVVAKMKPNAVILDVSIDQGGCFETSKPTTHYSPVYKLHGVIHYCVPNIASRFAHTASLALSNIIYNVLFKTAQLGGVDEMIHNYRWFMKSIISHRGAITNHIIAQKYNLKYKDLGLVSSAIN